MKNIYDRQSLLKKTQERLIPLDISHEVTLTFEK